MSREEETRIIDPFLPGNFRSKEPNRTESRYVRFFETPALLEPGTGRASAKIARFDLQEPVVFYYSANTPEDYVEAVKDGILYWNRAFGKTVVRAEKAPPGVTAPDANGNFYRIFRSQRLEPSGTPPVFTWCFSIVLRRFFS